MLNFTLRAYTSGVNIDPLALFDPVQLPVPRGTPSVASLIRLERVASFPVPSVDCFMARNVTGKGRRAVGQFRWECDVTQSQNEETASLLQYSVNGSQTVPPMFHIVRVWESFCSLHKKAIGDDAVILKDIKFHSDVEVPATGMSNIYNYD